MSCLMYFSNLLGNLMWSKHFEVAAEQGHKKSYFCMKWLSKQLDCIHTCQLSRSKGFNAFAFLNVRKWQILTQHALWQFGSVKCEAHNGNTLEAAVTQLCPAWVTAQRKGSVVSGSAGRPPPWPKRLGGNTTCQRLGGHTWHKQKWPLARPPWNPHPR